MADCTKFVKTVQKPDKSAKIKPSATKTVRSTNLTDLFPARTPSFVAELHSRVTAMGLDDRCALLDNLHRFEFISSLSASPAAPHAQGISPLSSYEGIIEDALRQSADLREAPEESTFAWLREMASSRFVGETLPIFDSFQLPVTEGEITEYVCGTTDRAVAYSLLIALRLASSRFPGRIGESTAICVAAVHRVTGTCRRLIAAGVGRGSPLGLEDYLQLVYMFKLGLLFCVLLERNEAAARQHSQRRFFAGSPADWKHHGEIFADCLGRHPMGFRRCPGEFSRFAVAEPRCLCALVIDFLEDATQREAQSRLGDCLSERVNSLVGQAKRIQKRFELPTGHIDDALTKTALRPPCIQKCSSRYTQKPSVTRDAEVKPDFTAAVSKNSFSKQLRANDRKRTMSDQRRKKDEHVDLVDSRHKLHSSNAQTAYKKLLHELQDQEHAMKTVDHHKALAMKGKKKK